MASKEELLNQTVSELCEKAEISPDTIGSISVIVMTKHDSCGEYHTPVLITTEEDLQKIMFNLYCAVMYVERAQIENAAANPN